MMHVGRHHKSIGGGGEGRKSRVHQEDTIKAVLDRNFNS